MAVTIFDVCKLGPITVQCIVYPFDQRPCRKRLREHKACAQTVCLLYDPVCRQSRHKNRRDFVPVLAQMLHNVKAALVRQQKIQQNRRNRNSRKGVRNPYVGSGKVRETPYGPVMRLSFNREDLVKLADENNTPFFSSSALRFSDELTTVGHDNIAFINSRGPGDFDTYSIHQIEPITVLMGSEATRVMAVGAGMHQTVVIEFKGGRSAVMSHYGWSGVDFNMTVSYTDGSTTVLPAMSNSFPNFIKAMCDFFRTGEIKAAHEETVAIMGIIEAGNKLSLIHI